MYLMYIPPLMLYWWCTLWHSLFFWWWFMRYTICWFAFDICYEMIYKCICMLIYDDHVVVLLWFTHIIWMVGYDVWCMIYTCYMMFYYHVLYWWPCGCKISMVLMPFWYPCEVCIWCMMYDISWYDLWYVFDEYWIMIDVWLLDLWF
jgi:hypothetical protein